MFRLWLPLMVTWIAPYGHRTSHAPQKLHFARSMSTYGFFAGLPSVLGCEVAIMAVFGQASVQIWQPTQRALSSVSLTVFICIFHSNTKASAESCLVLLNGI